MANKDIRDLARNSSVYLWQIGKRLGYKSDSTFSKMLREELDPATKERIVKIIQEISETDNIMIHSVGP